MAKQDFIPRREGDLLAWHDNFKTQFAILATTLGFGTNDVSALNTQNTAIHTAATTANAKLAEADSAIAAKKAALASAIDQARRFAARAKTHQSYTEAYGQQLGIIGPDGSTAVTPNKPDLKADLVQNGNVIISFFKGAFSGVEIRSRRAAETEFTFLARDTQSPYVDNRPNLTPAPGSPAVPEKREYVCQYLDGDELAGPVSDVLVVTVPA